MILTRFAIALLLTLTPTFAQIADIATDFTGSNLVFWTRFRLQSETDVVNQQKVYRWRNGEWSRLTSYVKTGGLLGGGLATPFVAADGAIYGWIELLEHGAVPMVRFPTTKGVLNGVTLPSNFPTEYFNISPNGRYIAGGTYNIQFIWRAEILDTQTGARTPWEIQGLPALADDGTRAYVWRTSRVTDLKVVSPGKRTQLFPIPNLGIGNVAISPNAQWVAVPLDKTVRVFSTSTGDSIDIVPGFRNGPGPVHKISNTRVLYLSEDFKQVMSLDPAKRESTVVMESPEPFKDLALSGDGNVAYAVTEMNRLSRINLITGSTTEILAPLPSNSSAYQTDSVIGEAVPGSAMLLAGKYTRKNTIHVDGQTWPISTLSDDELWFQIPWEYRGAPWDYGTGLSVHALRNPFESVFDFALVSDFRPFFPTRVDPNTSQTSAVAAHEDFSGVVSSDRPARPGETIHLYMTGLGPLVRDVPTGAPGPGDGVRTQRQIICYSTVPGNPARTPITVYSSFYAPNMIGFYQVDLAVPANAPTGTLVLHCGEGKDTDRVGLLPTRSN